MPMFQNPGSFFVGGTLVPAEQKFLKVLLETAVKSGYNRFVEPCAGTFAMSHLAVQAGFKSSQIENSDVSMMTTIMGYAIMGKPLEELFIHAKGFKDEELKSPEVALYAWKYLSTAKNAGKEYFYNFMLDLVSRKTEHIESVKEQLERAKQALGGMKYRALDMWKHLEEVYDDPNAIVIANPPTYLAGYEKFYDTAGNMTWKEPEYELFDPADGYNKLMEIMKDAKCLLLCYQESEPGGTAAEPVFARYGVRSGVNAYIISNKPDVAEKLARGKAIARPGESKLSSLECSMLPRDYEITPKTKIQLCQVERAEAQYYRQLWTHNFVGSAAPINIAVLIDGKIAGVFGVDKAALTMGAFGTQVSDALFLMYGMTVPHKKYRLGRLLTMLAQNKTFVFKICTDLEKEKVGHLKTVQMTKYPEAKEMRGVMKLTKRVPDTKMGFRLTYESELKSRTEKETLAEWLRKEEKWQKERAKTKAKSDMKK